MSELVPRPTDDVLDLVQACGEHLRQVDPHAVQKAFEPPEGGAHHVEPTHEQLEAVYATARQLCDQGNFRFASALAMHLVAHKPTEPRFSFMAGTCMQRLGLHANAMQFFCIALVSGGDDPAAFFRLGECLLAIGDKVNADKALDAAIDLSRDAERGRELQDAAGQLLESIKRSSL